MRVVMGAYACEPGRGSEPGVGWNWAVQAAERGHDVHVVTRANNRGVIEEELAARPVAGLTFHYIDLPRPATSLKLRTGYIGMLTYYYLWQLLLAVTARRLHRRLRFDAAHHVTFVIDWMPSGLAFLPVPFIWGPVGGSTHRTPRCLASRDVRATAYESVRWLAQSALGRLDPFVALTRRRADAILLYTDEAISALPSSVRDRCRSIVHIGVAVSQQQRPVQPPPPFPLRVLTGGRLVHWKGFDLLVDGLAKAVTEHSVDVSIMVTGEGPVRAELEDLARRRGVADRVLFTGFLPSRDDVEKALDDCHLYALPTTRDGPPVAILEAMLAARAVLCLDIGATHELVPDDAGFKLPVRNRRQVVDAIAGALHDASLDHARLVEMGRRGRETALRRNSWERIGQDIDALYDWISHRRLTEPVPRPQSYLGSRG